MYIVELISKLLSNLQNKRTKLKKKQEDSDYEKCEHIFLPIDSTGNVLACTKCGYLIKNNHV